MRMTDVSPSKWSTGAPRKKKINHGVRGPIHPLTGRERNVHPKRVAREAQAINAERTSVLHQNIEDRRVQVKMKVAVDMIERQAGGTEAGKLRVYFFAQLLAGAALKEIFEADFDRVVQKFAVIV